MYCKFLFWQRKPFSNKNQTYKKRNGTSRHEDFFRSFVTKNYQQCHPWSKFSVQSCVIWSVSVTSISRLVLVRMHTPNFFQTLFLHFSRREHLPLCSNGRRLPALPGRHCQQREKWGRLRGHLHILPTIRLQVIRFLCLGQSVLHQWRWQRFDLGFFDLQQISMQYIQIIYKNNLICPPQYHDMLTYFG